MRYFALIALSVLMLTLAAWAQDGNAVSQVQIASQRLAEQQKSGLLLDWLSRGKVAGESVAARLLNQSEKEMEIQFMPGMVFQDPEGRYQPFILETALTVGLAPGETRQLNNLRAYNLDHAKGPAVAQTHYNHQTLTDLNPYSPAIKALWAGIRRSAEGEMQPVVSPMLHKTVVLQRAIWASLGDPNPSTLEKLEKDIWADTLSGAHPFSQHKAKWMAGHFWKDVTATLEASKSE